MANELLTPGVAAGFIGVSAAGIGYSSWRMRKTMDESKIPLMGVMGAFVFAAQMVNFQILPGSSGHLGGGVLLAILLGPAAATLVMSAILIVQCLVFNDGGLLALGANIFNMGVLPCYLGYGIYRLILGREKQIASGRLYLACFVATFLGMLSGAAMVPIEVALSGVSAVPFGKFFAVMVGVHILIATVEGAVTFAVVLFIHKMRPSLVLEGAEVEGMMSRKAVMVTVLLVALVTGAFLSLIACGLPDGLEYVTSGKTVVNESNISKSVTAVTRFQDRVSPFPGYSKRAPEGHEAGAWWTSLSGILGSLIVLAILYAVAMLLRQRKKATPAEQR
ncbi:MAG: cobalamin biosynthesis protein CbiM [Planctomycetes bacterium]|nr:cobalamin biosynthesis protein CbiM [Planctomycetota bacterium]